MLMWGDFRDLSLQSMMMSPLLKGFAVGEEGIPAGVVASQLSSRDVPKTEVAGSQSLNKPFFTGS